MVPLGILIFCTLGSILGGLATPSEAAAIGCIGAMLLAVAYGRFTYAGLKAACVSTMTTASMVLFLAVASNIFGSVFSRLGSAQWVTQLLVSLPVAPVVMLIIIIALIFLLGWPFEWPAIILVFLPIFQPVVVVALKYDMVWFGVLVAVTLQTAYLSPPVAMPAYYLKQVVKEWNLSVIYRGMADFMVIQCFAVGLIFIFPSIAMWLPTTLAEGARVERIKENEAGRKAAAGKKGEEKIDSLEAGDLKDEDARAGDGKSGEGQAGAADAPEKDDLKVVPAKR